VPDPDAPRPRAGRRGVYARAAAYLAVWALLAAAAAGTLFLTGSRELVVASHDAVLEPTLDGQVVVLTGPVLPDVRRDSGGRVGVQIVLGKTEASSIAELARRYAYLASQPEGQVAAVQRALHELAAEAALRGTVLGLLPVLGWLVLGPRRRRELLRTARGPRGLPALGLVALLGLGLWQPWDHDGQPDEDAGTWMSLGTFLGPEVPLPDEARGIEVRGDVTTAQTRRLVSSAVDTYDKSKTFYADAAARAADLDLRRPQEGETVTTLVSDRHDNIGMDAVARAIGDAGGAQSVLDAGDDTSAGKSWEAFSLDSLDAAFHDLDRWGVTGNHDHGSFVRGYLADRDWTMLDGTSVPGPGGGPLTGVDDPRSSGLGSWRDESGLSYAEVGDRLADGVCDADERLATVLVHDADLADEVLRRGCADLVLGGHLHVQVGPTRVVGENGRAGYSYTNGTTGGAAYAIAVGSKPRRPAEVTLVTYRDGRPAGLQPVVLQSDGRFVVGRYRRLFLDGETGPAGRSERSAQK
jgi:hypothetical protein